MIKRYLSFISESYKGFSSKADYIANKAEDSEYVRHLVGDYTKDINPNVNVASSINTLDEHTQDLILKMIDDFETDKRYPDEIIATPHTSIRYDESQQTGGKNIFSCFLKVVSALGQKDCEIDWKHTPEDYIGLFVSNSVDIEELKGVLSRYLYFDDFIKSRDIKNRFGKLYWGVKNDMSVEYGVYLDGSTNVLGSFMLTQGTYNYVMTLSLKSATNLKKLLVSLDLPKLSILTKVKMAMKDFFPGQSDGKLNPTINGDIISYGFEGLGKWDNGQIDPSELENVKNNLRTHLMQFKWSDKLQFSVTPSNNWVFINIKIK